MPATDSLKYNDVSFKASHNSYDRDESTQEQLTFFSSDPSKCGCRGLEFDIWRHSEQQEKFFTVSHTQIFSSGPSLASYLGQVLSWHQSNPRHDPILITLDIKSSQGDFHTFPDEIDNYVTKYFNANLIFRPSNLLYSSGLSLLQNVVALGWPQIGSMRDKFIFCLSGTEDWKNYYASLDPRYRLCFCDKDFDDNNSGIFPPSAGNFVFFNVHLFSDHHDKWKLTIPRFKARNLIVRAYEIDGEVLWQNSLAAGVSALATNQVSGKSWAKVSNTAFVQRT